MPMVTKKKMRKKGAAMQMMARKKMANSKRQTEQMAKRVWGRSSGFFQSGPEVVRKITFVHPGPNCFLDVADDHPPIPPLIFVPPRN